MNNRIIISGPHASGKTRITNAIAGLFPEAYVKRYTGPQFAQDADVRQMKVYRLVIIEEVIHEAQLSDIVELFRDEAALASTALIITTQIGGKMEDCCHIDQYKTIAPYVNAPYVNGKE